MLQHAVLVDREERAARDNAARNLRGFDRQGGQVGAVRDGAYAELVEQLQSGFFASFDSFCGKNEQKVRQKEEHSSSYYPKI